MADFTLNVDADGVATITWDVPGKSMNVLSYEALAELNAHVDTVLADDAIRRAVIPPYVHFPVFCNIPQQ